MPESQRISEIRETIRNWMNEPIADEETKYGKELQDNIRRLWPEIFTDQPNRPIMNRDALTMAIAYLQEAAHFTQQNDSARVDELHAEIAGVTVDKIQKMRDKTILSDTHIRAVASSLCKLATDEELSMADTQRHLGNVKWAVRVMREAEETVTGERSMGEFMDTQPGRHALMDALDNAIESFKAYKIRSLIEGKGRGRGNDDSNDA